MNPSYSAVKNKNISNSSAGQIYRDCILDLRKLSIPTCVQGMHVQCASCPSLQRRSWNQAKLTRKPASIFNKLPRKQCGATANQEAGTTACLSDTVRVLQIYTFISTSSNLHLHIYFFKSTPSYLHTPLQILRQLLKNIREIFEKICNC